MSPCCQEQENREEPVRLSESLVVAACRVCGAKHYELEVDPGNLFAEATEL